MTLEDTKSKIIAFSETIEKYYGCKTEITEGLYSRAESFDVNFTTWNLSEFILIRSAYRKNGDRLMMEGKNTYYEIAAGTIVSFEQPGQNIFEFIERYGDTVYRITKIKFYQKR